MWPSLPIYPDAIHTKKYVMRPSIHRVTRCAVLVGGGGRGGGAPQKSMRVL